MASCPRPVFGQLAFLLSFILLTLIPSSSAYTSIISDADYSRQTCSGMWGGSSAYINVTFDPSSQGHLAMIIYEWKDVKYLGKETTSTTDDDLPQKTYVCTTSAMTAGYCTSSQLGRFILNLPPGKSVNETSFWSARVELSTNGTAGDAKASGFWDNPEGNPTPPDDPFASPWRRHPVKEVDVLARWAPTSTGPDNRLTYNAPIYYPVSKSGYYCVAAIPFTVQGSSRRAPTGVPYHPSYNATVLFKNTFDGQLPASDYPKVPFYFVMFVIYSSIALLWGWSCYRHIQDLLPIQYYLSGLVGLLVIEMLANWVYYRYLNAHGKSTASTVFLIVVAILDAGRNSMSFFMLLVVSLGLSVVKESLSQMVKCQILTVVHFIFGILYAIGIVELELESVSAFVLLLFIIPLSFTLSAFFLWIMAALHATIAQLKARKQRYKLSMFQKLHYILTFTIVIVIIFFVVSTMTWSGRSAEDYSASSWRNRWWLLDGWLALLYLVAFSFIAFLWRPSDNNRRLAMSDEIAQDEEDAEDYDLEAIQHRSRVREEDDDDAATLVAGRRGNPTGPVGEESVVFEIGDEDEEDEDVKKRKIERLSGENRRNSGEHEGLMR